MNVSPATPISNNLQEPVRFLVFSDLLRDASLNSSWASLADRRYAYELRRLMSKRQSYFSQTQRRHLSAREADGKW